MKFLKKFTEDLESRDIHQYTGHDEDGNPLNYQGNILPLKDDEVVEDNNLTENESKLLSEILNHALSVGYVSGLPSWKIAKHLLKPSKYELDPEDIELINNILKKIVK